MIFKLIIAFFLGVIFDATISKLLFDRNWFGVMYVKDNDIYVSIKDSPDTIKNRRFIILSVVDADETSR